MIRAGISLPALMQLMGHAQIETTMVYVSITPQDVYQQYRVGGSGAAAARQQQQGDREGE